MKRFGICSAAVWFLLLFVSLYAAAEPAGAGDDLAALIPEIEKVTASSEDIYDTLYLRADLLGEAAVVAWLVQDKTALAAAKDALLAISKRGVEMQDPYLRDLSRAYVCLTIAALGDPESAQRKARVLALRGYGAFAMGMLASERARAGDRDGFERFSDESLAMLGSALKADMLRGPDEREYPSWAAWCFFSDWQGDAYGAGLMGRDLAHAHLLKQAAVVESLPLEPGAAAEVYACISCGLSALSDENGARAWLTKADMPLQREYERMAKIEQNEDAWWGYGTDAARLDLVRACLLIQDEKAAAGHLQHLDFYNKKKQGHAIMAAGYVAQGRPGHAQPHLDALGTFVLEADAFVKALKQEPANAQEAKALIQERRDERWQDYTDLQLFWDAFYIAKDLVHAGEAARVKQWLAQVNTLAARAGLRFGSLHAQARASQYKLVPVP